MSERAAHAPPPRRVAIAHQGYIPPYRVRFFELLSERSPRTYVVLHGRPPAGTEGGGAQAATGPFAFPNVPVRSFEIELAGKGLLYQAVVRPFVAGRFDAVVLGTHAQLLSHHVLFALAKVRRIPVILWGHGEERVTADGGLAHRLSRLAVAAKDVRDRRADGYLAYTAGGARRVRERGIDAARVHAVDNTIDAEEERRHAALTRRRDPAALRRELGLRPDSIVLLLVGRLYAGKRASDLVRLVRRLEALDGPLPPVEAVIIGDGPELAAVREQARDMASVHVLGEIRDPAALASCFAVAAAVVVPGVVGLVAPQALVHGVPVMTIASSAHGPEIEYLSPGENAFLAADFEDLVRFVSAFVRSPERRRAMASAAAAAGAVPLDRMVDAFDAAVTAICGVHRGTR